MDQATLQKARAELARLGLEAKDIARLREAHKLLISRFRHGTTLESVDRALVDHAFSINRDARPHLAAIASAEAEKDPRPKGCEHFEAPVECGLADNALGVCTPGLCPLVGEITPLGRQALEARRREGAAVA